MGLSQLIQEGTKKFVGYSVASDNESVVKDDRNVTDMTQDEKKPDEDKKAEESDDSVCGPPVID
jgi:hypothetical protein